MHATDDEVGSAETRQGEHAPESQRRQDARDGRMDTFMEQADHQSKRLNEREAQLARIELKLDEVLDLLRSRR